MTNSETAPRRRSMVKNVIHLGLGQVATTTLTILTTATLARFLGPADFGLMFLISSIAGFTYIVVDWGHAPLIIRDTARHPGKSGILIGSALAVRTAVALLACPVVFSAMWLLGYELRTRLLTVGMILAWMPTYLGMSYGWVFRGHERMDFDAMLNVVLKILILACAIACLALGGGVPELVLMSAVAGCVTLVIAMAMYRRLELPAVSATLATARELLRDGYPLFAMSLAVAVEPLINANILYKMTTPETVGWYGAAWNIAGSLIAPASILGGTMYPRLSMAADDAAEFKRNFNVSFRPLLLLAVLGAVGTYLFADVAIGLIYGLEKFGPAADVLRAFAPVLLLMYVDIYLGMAITAAGKAGRLAIVKVISVALMTGLVLVLVPICQARFGNGGLGVMYGLLIGEVLMLVAAGILLRNSIDRRTLGDLCRNLVAGALTVLSIRLLPALTPFLTIPVCVLIFAGVSWIVGAIRQSDVEMLAASFRKRAPA